jgi:Right handed beta helix region
VIETGEDGQLPISVEASSVRLRNLTLRTIGNQSAVRITQGDLAMEGCVVTPAVSAARQSAPAIEIAGETSSFSTRKCSISGYDCAISASGGASIEVDESTSIKGRWRADAEAAEGRNTAIVAGPGTSLDVSPDVNIECFATGIEADRPVALNVTGARFAHCAIALAISGAEPQSIVEDCEFVDTGIAVKVSHSNVAIRKCTIGYLETGILVEGGNVVVERCKRISGPQWDADPPRSGSYPREAFSYGISVKGKGVARIVSCRLFGAGPALDVSDDSSVSGTDCEMFGGVRFAIVSKGSLALDSCQIHDSQIGLVLEGVANLARCVIRDHKGLSGIVVQEGELTMTDCYLYRNAAEGIHTWSRPTKLTMKDTVVTLNRKALRVTERDELHLEGCTFRQNAIGHDIKAKRSFVERCHFDVVSPYFDDDLTIKSWPEFDSAGNHYHPSYDCKATDGSGGHSNSIYHQDFLFGEFSRAIDSVEQFIRVKLHDWSSDTPQASADGRQMKFVLTRSAILNDRLKPISLWAKLREGLTAGQGGSLVTRANIQFDMRITVLIGAESLAPGLEKMTVTIEEFEEVDRSNASGYQLGEHYFARSMLTGLQVGCSLLQSIQNSLTPRFP